MIDTAKPIAGLFDLDGVVLDTESQYSVFWSEVMRKYKGDAALALKLKGMTLEHIFAAWFPGREAEQKEIAGALNEFEARMEMRYIPGAREFIGELKGRGVKLAVVTSSNEIKMRAVYRQHRELTELFDRILTAELFARSKPDPDCYLLGASVFGTTADNCFVFEDSFNGLRAGLAAKMRVVGLATTNPAREIDEFADVVIPDFTEMTYERLLAVTRRPRG